jgi:hypothetical protein
MTGYQLYCLSVQTLPTSQHLLQVLPGSTITLVCSSCIMYAATVHPAVQLFNATIQNVLPTHGWLTHVLFF